MKNIQRRAMWTSAVGIPLILSGVIGATTVNGTISSKGLAYIFAFGLAANMHNYAPSIDGMRTKQAIALAKANNPGVAAQGDEPQKKSLWQKITRQKDKGQ